MKKRFALLMCIFCFQAVSLAAEPDTDQYGRLEQECAGNRLDSCILYAGKIRELSPTLALIPLLKACNGGNMKGCTGLAALYSDAENGTGLDLKKAKMLYGRACKNGEQTACRSLKNLNGKKTQGIGKSSYLARLKNACNLGNVIPCVEQVAYACAGGNPEACEALCDNDDAVACSIRGGR